MIAAGGQRFGIKSVYALALSLELVLLSAFLLSAQWTLGHGIRPGYAIIWLPAMAMGLQNATITQIAGAVVRTTHVTGSADRSGHRVGATALLAARENLRPACSSGFAVPSRSRPNTPRFSA
jgi:uncharacterized membrane protein YoaK (UPF0700 family)